MMVVQQIALQEHLLNKGRSLIRVRHHHELKTENVMKPTFYIFTLIMVAGTLLAASCEKSDQAVPTGDLPDPIQIELRASEREMVRADQSFAFELFQHVFTEEAKEDDANFMVSPLSLSMALAMTSNGAASDTKAAIQSALKLAEYSEEEVNQYYRKLKEALLNTDPSTRLSIANAIFTNQFVEIHKDFISTNQTYYDATVQQVNFSDPKTVGIINGWASDNTNGLIKKVIEKTKPEDLMYLLNAIYFKGIWTNEFSPNNTSSKPFYPEDGNQVNVDMMHQTEEFNYTEDETLQMVRLPYGNQAFSMMVLLPKDEINLAEAVSALRADGYWSALQSTLHPAKVDLSLPKFKTEYSKILNEVLANMGMGSAFTNQADFSGMTDEPAQISFVKQDTYISTDEKGTEAAAVTTIGIELTSMPMEPRRVIFNADRPFLYVIQENSTGSILFMGAVKKFN